MLRCGCGAVAFIFSIYLNPVLYSVLNGCYVFVAVDDAASTQAGGHVAVSGENWEDELISSGQSSKENSVEKEVRSYTQPSKHSLTTGKIYKYTTSSELNSFTCNTVIQLVFCKN